MGSIRAICLDLDDTLWPVAPVIAAAEGAMVAWLEEHCPRVTTGGRLDGLRDMRLRVAAEHPERVHDLTFLRLRSLEWLARESGYPVAVAEQAFAAFQAMRNRVELFPDVLPALQQLQGRYRLLSLSNGNADLGLIGLQGFFELSLTAREAGAAKPDRRIFTALLQRCGLAPEEVVHVGDDPHADVEGARSAGLGAVWVDRRDAVWPAELPAPVARVSNLGELLAWLED